MVFTRKVSFSVSFNWYTGGCSDRFNDSLSKTYEISKDYDNKEDAYRIGNELEDWAEKVANYNAIKSVSAFIGTDAPIFRESTTWKDIRNVNGTTYSGCDIKWDVLSVEEPLICADADIAEYIFVSDNLARHQAAIARLSDRRKELLKKERRTNKEVDELRKTNNDLERMFKIETKEMNELARLKEKCPGIEEQVKQKKTQEK